MKRENDEGLEIRVGRWLAINARGAKVVFAIILGVLALSGMPVDVAAAALALLR